MFCTKCGAQVPEGNQFCTKCGAPINNPEAKPNAATAAKAPVKSNAAANVNSPATAVKKAGKGFWNELWADCLDLLKHPKKLIPTFVLSGIWLIFSLLSTMNIANIPIFRFLYTLTYSNGGMFGGFFGAIGGILGKALFAAFVNFIVLCLVNKQNPFYGFKKGIKSITVSGVSAVSPFIIGGGTGLLLYWFFNITSSPVNSMIALVSALAFIRAAGSQNGALFNLAFYIMGKLSKGRAPSRATVSRFLTGVSAGFVIGYPVTFARYAFILFVSGFSFLVIGIILELVLKSNRSAVAAMFIVVLCGSMFFPTALSVSADFDEPYIPYNGRLTYTNGTYNKYGQPFPDLMDFNKNGAIDYLDRVTQHYLVHNPDYLNQPQSKLGAAALSTTVFILGTGAAVGASAVGGAIGTAASSLADAAGSAASSIEFAGNGGDAEEYDENGDPKDLGPHIKRDADGDLVVKDPATGEERVYVRQEDGTYKNPLTDATYTAAGLKQQLESIDDNKANIQKDKAFADSAREEQRAANQEESFYSKEAREEDAARAAEEAKNAAHDAYVTNLRIKYNVLDGDEKDLKKEIMKEQIENYVEGNDQMAKAGYMDAGLKTAEQTEKAADVALDVLEQFDKTGTAKLVKDGYAAGKAYGQGLMEAATGEKSFAGAMTAASVKTGAEVAKNHLGDYAGGGVSGLAIEGSANVALDGTSKTVDELARGKSLEDSLKAGSDEALKSAKNFAIDKTFDGVADAAGGKFFGESAGDKVGSFLGSEVTKETALGAGNALAKDVTKEVTSDD